MPLLDHFHGPVAFRPWQSFYGQWCSCIAADLNRRLPPPFVADGPMNILSGAAADVVEYETRPGLEAANGAAGPDHGGGGVATPWLRN